MNWNSTADFLAMGGYGLYVWGSIAATAACLIAEPLLLRRRRHTAMAQLKSRRNLEKEMLNEKSP